MNDHPGDGQSRTRTEPQRDRVPYAVPQKANPDGCALFVFLYENFTNLLTRTGKSIIILTSVKPVIKSSNHHDASKRAAVGVNAVFEW